MPALLWRVVVRCLRPLFFVLRFVLRSISGLIPLPRPISNSLLVGTISDLARSRAELLLENALLRQQIIALQRHGQRPYLTNTDRTIMVVLAGKLQTWKTARLLVPPDTLLRWHRAGFRTLWTSTSHPTARSHKPKLSAENIALIKQLARENRRWSAERIRGELLKLNIHVAKRTIQKYMQAVREPQPKTPSPHRRVGLPSCTTTPALKP